MIRFYDASSQTRKIWHMILWAAEWTCKWQDHVDSTPKGTTSFSDWGSYEYDQTIRVRLCLLCLVV